MQVNKTAFYIFLIFLLMEEKEIILIIFVIFKEIDIMNSIIIAIRNFRIITEIS